MRIFVIIFFFIIFFNFHFSKSLFDLTIAKQQLLIAFSSYCPPSNLKEWNCFYCDYQGSVNVTVTSIIFDQETETLAFIGYHGKTIQVSIRGTVASSVINWITDFNFKLVPLDDNRPDIKVHSGFRDAFEKTKSSIRNAVTSTKKLCPSCNKIMVTGHSLGGAIATLISLDLINLSNLPVIEYSFGSPRVGSPEFAEYYSSSGISESWRMVHNKDIVPHLPVLLVGYQHVPIEIWEISDTFKQCDNSGEDPNCSDSVKIPSINDHLFYMGIDSRAGKPSGCS